MDYKKLAEDILENVGGSANIVGLTHCASTSETKPPLKQRPSKN